MKKKSKRRIVSLFTGVGGLDFGFEAAGFETSVALDNDLVACDTIRQNRRWPVISAEIARVPSKDILKVAGLKVGQADVLIGGPPCQPFSKSGYWVNGDSRRLDDPRADTVKEFMRVLRDTLPRSFLLENVLGFAFAEKSEGLEFVQREITKINKQKGTKYTLHAKALNAAEYGVPQMRERFFIVGSREGIPFVFPSPTHRRISNVEAHNDLRPFLTAWDAIGDLRVNGKDPALALTGKWADLLPTVPEGQNYLWHTPRGGGFPLFGWRTRYWNFLLKLAKNQPAWTIQAQPGPATGPFHWDNRKFAATELARLQTFPDGLKFICKQSEVQRLIGNAVPSALAETLAREMRAQFFGEPFRRGPLKLLPPKRLRVPPPEELAELPKKYRALIGKHADHPGAGKGARALRRFQRVA